MPRADAILEERDGRPALRFERVLAHPPERVWRALTDPAEEAAWHPTPARFEARVGDGEPDHLLFELRPHDEGSLLVLVHSFADRLKAARDGAGWHVCLDALASVLAGAPEPPGGDPDEPGPWTELNALYEQKFGIPPERPQPPPGRG